MADTEPAGKMYLTTRHLKYNSTIRKIPEFFKVDLDYFDELSCLNTNMATHVQEDLFKIIGELYNVPNL